MDSSSLTKSSLLYTSSDGKTNVYRGLLDQYPVVIKERRFTSPSQASDALKEYETQRQLSHEHICRVFECRLSEDYLSVTIVLESMEIDLAKEVQNRRQNSYPWSEDQLWGYFWQLINALTYAQQQGICHRDIKPQNIFLTFDKQLKIGDFGTAKYLENSITSTLVGTPYYLSPELKSRFQGRRAEAQEYNPFKSDVYSLGLTFLYMVRLGENIELTYLESLERNTEVAILSQFVSDPMKALLGEMLRVGDRYDFLDMQGYLASLYQIPPENPYPEAPQESANILDLQTLEWQLNNSDSEALKQIFLIPNIRISYSCTMSLRCSACSQYFTVDISQCATEDDTFYCSLGCKNQICARSQELLSYQEQWRDYKPEEKEPIYEENKEDLGRDTYVLPSQVFIEVLSDDCSFSPESKSSQEKEANQLAPSVVATDKKQVMPAKEPVEIVPRPKVQEKPQEVINRKSGHPNDKKPTSKQINPNPNKPMKSNTPAKSASSSIQQKPGQNLDLMVCGTKAGTEFPINSPVKRLSKKTT